VVVNKKGFTLVELVVAVLVLGMILAVVYRFFFYEEQLLRLQRQWSELNIVSRKASTYIAKEFRNIGFCDKTGSGAGVAQAFGIIDGSTNNISYSHDIDGDLIGIVDAEDIHSIGISSDTLYIDGSFALDNVVSLEFTYIDTTGDTVENVTEVDQFGVWILPVGQEPIEHISYRLSLSSPLAKFKDTVIYDGLVTLRNKRP
jgi:prepilin-type N-terminal cleavage/methylation domain-containing protein